MSTKYFTSYNILIVDDRELDRNGICYLIKQNNLRLKPITASSGSEALKILSSQPVHILLTDIKMPEMMGHELIQKAQNDYPHVKIVIYSAYDRFDYVHKAMDLGVMQYLLKPIKVEKFIKCMNGIITELDEDQKLLIQNIYYDLMTGRECSDKLKNFSISPTGALFLIEFFEPFFNSNTVFPLISEKGNPGVTEIPLNEYQCAYVAASPELAQSTIEQIKQLIRQKNSFLRFVIVYGGQFTSHTELRILFEKMENFCSSNFYYTESPTIDLTNQNNSEPSFKARYFLNKIGHIDQMIQRRELNNAQAEIDEVFNEFKKHSFLPSSFAKFISNEIVRACLDERSEDYDKTLLSYIREIENSVCIEDLLNICTNVVNKHLNQDEETMVIDRVLNIIHNRYMGNLSLESVADEVYLSPCYLSYLFKKNTGMNFVKYLTSYRVETAKKLLRTTPLKIRVICEKVGYSNVSYFCQIFKNHCGMTPAQFRCSKL